MTLQRDSWLREFCLTHRHARREVIEDKIITEKKTFTAWGRLVFTLIVIALLITGIFLLVRSMGRRSLYELSSGLESDTADVGEAVQNGSPDTGIEEGHIVYNGKEYAPNKDLICILVMGLDKETVTEIGGQSWESNPDSYNNGGQADALFLVLLNPHDESINVVSINRNAMADVDVWDDEGNYRGILKEQIALQHGYGNDEVACAEHQVKAVSRFFHNIPIHAYAAISMDAIPELNDAVGGVTLEVLDDIVYPEYDMDLHRGQIVTLMGDKAYWYVRLRHEDEFDSNSVRLERQKQYLTTFAVTARERVNGDITVAVSLFTTLQKYMVTDLNVSSYTYLATETMDYSFDADNIYSVQGETLQGEMFEEFYADDDALQDLIIKLFYEPA